MDESNHKIRNESKTHILYKKYIQSEWFERLHRFFSDLIFLENLVTEHNELVSFLKASYYENLRKKIK